MTGESALTGDRVIPIRDTGRIARSFHAQKTALPPLSEKDFQRQVMDLAAILGWRVYHPMLSKSSERGWPDLAMVRPPRFILAELKRQDGKTSIYQSEWLELLNACPGIETYLWRPADLDSIAEILR